jgi:hypothetical protein
MGDYRANITGRERGHRGEEPGRSPGRLTSRQAMGTGAAGGATALTGASKH